MKILNYKRGMSYIELIVVLSIFSLLSTVVIYNYGGFQAKVDVKNLASDIGLKILEAQKAALSGQYHSSEYSDWKPTYGVHFDISSGKGAGGDNKSFFYFADLNSNGELDDSTSCSNTSEGFDECKEKITITKNNIISQLNAVYGGDTGSGNLTNLTITFARPSSRAILFSDGQELLNVSYVQITIISPNSYQSVVKVYPSGRIQIN